MANVLDGWKQRLSVRIAYTPQEEQAMRPYNQFMSSVTGAIPVESMPKHVEQAFCIFAACALEEAWTKYVLADGREGDEARFLEVLLRYLLNVIRVDEASVATFVEDGPALMASRLGVELAQLAAKTFRDYGDGDLKAASGFKFFAEKMDAPPA